MIEIAFPTRNRPREVRNTLESLFGTLPPGAHVPIHVIHDDPPEELGQESMDVVASLLRPYDRQIINQDKSSLTQLWNQCILSTRSDWVLIASDDIKFQPGWYEYLKEQTESGKWLQVMMMSFCAFCVHKSMVLHIGWFDERFRGGYYEDNDWQLRVAESKLKHRVDYSRNEQLIHNRPTTTHKWHCVNNHHWIQEKWHNIYDWTRPSFRQVGEEKLYPLVTAGYEIDYGMKSRIPIINSTMVKNGVGVFQ